MTVAKLIEAALLGLLEGLTEFIPVSSTGHLLLAGYFLGFQSTGKAFEVLIQLGAILAIVVLYFAKLWSVFIRLPSDPAARRFAIGIVIAFLPAAIIGATLHGFIKGVLFETPMLICVMLIVGGVILFVVDRLDLKPRYSDAMQLPPLLALKIGFCQTLALIPGVSRSGATIVGALLLGVEKRAAAEFSFFLAMPTMVGAFVYDLYKNRASLSLDDGLLIVVGFVAAFCAAIVVVRMLLDFVSKNGFRLLRAVADRGRRPGSGRAAFGALSFSSPARELAGLAEAAEIARQHRSERGRRNTEPLQRAAFALGFGRDDIVALEQDHLVAREQWIGQAARGRRPAAARSRTESAPGGAADRSRRASVPSARGTSSPRGRRARRSCRLSLYLRAP